jgi:cupin 2 domain-containing protein
MAVSSENLFAPLPECLPVERVDVLTPPGVVRVERIVSMGHTSPPGFWYDQSEVEWVAVLRGAARIAYDDGTIEELRVGDHTVIPAHRRHRVAWTTPDEPTIWLAVFYPG